MGARSKARKRALDVLYAAELRGESALEALERAIAAGEGPPNAYTETLVRGVVEQGARIDELLGEFSSGWSLERMPAVDRNVLRIGAFELLCTDTPASVVIDQAVELARRFGDEPSPAFVNGILDALARSLGRGGVAPAEDA